MVINFVIKGIFYPQTSELATLLFGEGSYVMQMIPTSTWPIFQFIKKENKQMRFKYMI